jgi:AraC-like DNA-binding protein
MIGAGTATFTDPGDYQARLVGTNTNLVLTCGGDFKARLTWVELPRLRLLHAREDVARIAFAKLKPWMVFVAFPTSFDPPQIWGGVKLNPGDIVFHSLGEQIHQRTSGASQWGFISLAHKDLAACSKALTGIDLGRPPSTRTLRPPSESTVHLLRLHDQACRLAETKPEIIARRETARALEHDLLYTLVHCLTGTDENEHTTARRRQASIMGRFEAVLGTHWDRQLHAHELSEAVGVPERTLRICCAEFLGMSPGSYVRLRRLNLVRAALRRAEPATATVAEIARRYGFSELGRFAGAYRTVFGETPSTTLRLVRSRARDPASAEFA